MIANRVRSGYEIITHYAHGLQAGQIAQHIDPKHRPPHWIKTLCAIIEHDDEQVHFENNNNVDAQGHPVDFTNLESTPSDMLEHCQRLIHQSRHRSGWVTLLVAQHLEFLYASKAQDYKPLKEYFDFLNDLQIKLRRLFKINKSQATEYYQVLKFCDRCSLILAMGQIPTNERRIEINHSISGQTYFMHCVDGKLNVDPWIFEPCEFTITTEVYEVDNTTFASSGELQKYLLTSIPVLKTWKFKKM